MFAGPNGSGKSTIKAMVPPGLLGVYINPDEMQKDMAERGFLNMRDYGLSTTAADILDFFKRSTLLEKAGMTDMVSDLRFSDGKLDFSSIAVNAYHASVAADFIRQKLLETSRSFSFETVMSSADKVELLKKARLAGYRTYLYFIATNDPSINIGRVKARVNLGGHDVPEDKIIQRYQRSLDLLLEAISHTSRTYLFDNSTEGVGQLWVAEITDGEDLELKCDPMPLWFQKAIWEKSGHTA